MLLFAAKGGYTVIHNGSLECLSTFPQEVMSLSSGLIE